jgi:hypothetical protein
VADSNNTEADDLARLDRLLVSRLLDALNGDAPTASTMAVAQKYLAGRKIIGKPAASPSNSLQTDNLPFPQVPHDDGGRAVKLAAALTVPFLADGSPNPAKIS